jgi:hypothetical protein
VRDYDDLLMDRYSIPVLCIQRTNDRRSSRQLASFSLAIGFRCPNLLRAAGTQLPVALRQIGTTGYVLLMKRKCFDIGWIGRIQPCVCAAAHHLDPKVRTTL